MMKRISKNQQFGGELVYFPEEEEREINLLEILQVLIKRKWVIIACVGAAVFFAGVVVFKVTPKYKAASTMMIEEEASRILSIEDEFGFRRSMADIRFFNTQLKLLQSKSLVERVARKLDLLNHPLFAGNTKNRNKDAEIVNPYHRLTKSLQESLNVSPVRETRLIEVSYTSSDPVFAALLVNTLSQEFVDFYIEKRYETTQQASKFLGEQISSLGESLSTKEAELQEYSQAKNLYFLSEKESAAVSKFSDINQAYTEAQIDRINAESNYRELKNLQIDSLPQFIDNTVLQDLRTEYVRLKNEYEEKSKFFKPDYPDMLKLRAKLDSMKSELESEIDKGKGVAQTEYRTALNKESSLKQLLEQQKADVAQMNSDAILYNNLKIEVENMRKLLDSLEERQKETLVSASLGELKTTNISIIDKAEPPLNPVYPKKKLSLILAFIIGLFGGVGLCFVLEYVDNTVKSPEDSEKLAGLPSLGVVPFLPPDGIKKIRRHEYYHRYHYAEEEGGDGKSGKVSQIKEIELINHLFPSFSLSEDYRTVRTSILLSSAERPPKSIVFTSALPKDGKTVTVANMAVAFGQLNEKVLVIDADMRKPKQHQIFKVKSSPGLSSYLTGKAALRECIRESKVDGISLLPCGPVPPNPAELLNSKPMKELMADIKDKFDVILLDTPPVLAVVDPVIVSTLVEATVLVVYPRKTTDKAFLSAVEELRKGKTKIIGTIFNGMRLDKDEYYYSRFYKSYKKSRGYRERTEDMDPEKNV
jgi:succinoglycan biosynthesis transport protein ExoP